MTGRERIRRLLDGERVERAPVMASFIAAGAAWRRVPQRRIHLEPELNAATLLGMSRELGLDGAYISSDNWILHSALGGPVEFPEDDEPRSAVRVLDEWDKLQNLAVPQPEKAERMSFMLAAARHAVALNRGELFLEANIDSGAFQLAGILRGIERFMYDLTQETRRVHRLLEFCTEVVKAYATAMARTGVDAIQFGDSTASLINAPMYEEFVLPYQLPVVEAIRRGGAHPFLHVCGNSTHLSKLLVASGAACVEIDAPADLRKTIDTFANRAAIRGNVPTMLLRDGPIREIEACARRCLEIARGSRFILSPGCGVPKGTPIEHIRLLRRVVQQANAC